MVGAVLQILFILPHNHFYSIPLHGSTKARNGIWNRCDCCEEREGKPPCNYECRNWWVTLQSSWSSRKPHWYQRRNKTNFSLPSDIDPPRDLEEVESTETTLTLRWQKPRAKIGAYRLVYVSEDGQVKEGEIPATATSYVVSNLTPGMSYNITLVAERGLKKSKPVTRSASTGG